MIAFAYADASDEVDAVVWIEVDDREGVQLWASLAIVTSNFDVRTLVAHGRVVAKA